MPYALYGSFRIVNIKQQNFKIFVKFWKNFWPQSEKHAYLNKKSFYYANCKKNLKKMDLFDISLFAL